MAGQYLRHKVLPSTGQYLRNPLQASGLPLSLTVGTVTIATPSASYRGADCLDESWPAEYGPNLANSPGAGALLQQNGPSGAPSPFNKAMSPNGVETYNVGAASVALAPDSGDIWYDLIVKAPPTFAAQYVVHQEDAGGASHLVRLGWNTAGRMQFLMRDALNVLVILNTGTIFTANTWYYAALVWDEDQANGFALYVPQVNQSTNVGTADPTPLGAVSPTVGTGHSIGGTPGPASICTNSIGLVRAYKRSNLYVHATRDADCAAAATARARALRMI